MSFRMEHIPIAIRALGKIITYTNNSHGNKCANNNNSSMAASCIISRPLQSIVSKMGWMQVHLGILRKQSLTLNFRRGVDEMKSTEAQLM